MYGLSLNEDRQKPIQTQKKKAKFEQPKTEDNGFSVWKTLQSHIYGEHMEQGGTFTGLTDNGMQITGGGQTTGQITTGGPTTIVDNHETIKVTDRTRFTDDDLIDYEEYHRNKHADHVLRQDDKVQKHERNLINRLSLNTPLNAVPIFVPLAILAVYALYKK